MSANLSRKSTMAAASTSSNCLADELLRTSQDLWHPHPRPCRPHLRRQPSGLAIPRLQTAERRSHATTRLRETLTSTLWMQSVGPHNGRENGEESPKHLRFPSHAQLIPPQHQRSDRPLCGRHGLCRCHACSIWRFISSRGLRMRLVGWSAATCEHAHGNRRRSSHIDDRKPRVGECAARRGDHLAQHGSAHTAQTVPCPTMPTTRLPRR